MHRRSSLHSTAIKDSIGHRAIWLNLLALVLFVTSTNVLHAQSVGSGQIQGTVTDQTGNAVAGATVEAVQQESNLQRTATTSADGGYTFPNLPVGPYQLNVSSPGFNTYHQSGIVIQVGNNLRIDVKLQIGAVSQTVQVMSDASMVQTEDQSISQVIDRQRTIDLPLNGRQATQLILLTPGAAVAPAGDLVGTKNYPSSVALSVAGAQATNINYLMDGADNNDAFTNVNLPFPFPDALQEFSVQTSGLSAQYGLHPGAVVNIVTRSGTNAFHGTVFDFFRNGAMNARNYFSTKQDSLKRNQFGGAVGGPIRRDKLFFFGGYQGTRTRQQSNAVTSFVPTAAMLNGDFSAYTTDSACLKQLKGPFVNNRVSPSRLNSSALQLAKYLPVATDPCGRIIYGIPQPQNEDQYIGRIDWTANQKQTIFGRYFITHFTQPGFFNYNLLLTQNPSLNDQAQSFTLGHTYTISSNLVNSLRINGTRNFITRSASSDLINPTNVGIQVSSPVKNYIYMNVTGAFTAACGTCESTDITTNSVNLVEDLFLTKGKHHWSFGVNYIHNYLVYDGTNNANGQFTFNGIVSGDSLADFLIGGLQQIYQGNNTGDDFSKNYTGIYAQDSLQLSSRLTINLGIRWATGLPAIETTGRGASFSPANYAAGVRSGVYPTAPPGLLFYGDPGVPHGYYHAKYDHFEPRFGVAFDPRGLGLESIRASYTLGYQEPPLYYQSHFEAMAPWGDSITLVQPAGGLSNPYLGYPGGNPFPKPFPPTPANAFFPTAGSYFVVPTNLQQAYSQVWNLSVEKQFLKNWSLTASYLGTRVLHNSAGNEQNPAVYIPGNSTGQPGSCGTLSPVPAAGSPCSSTTNTNARRVLSLINQTQGAYYTQITQAYTGLGSNFNGLLVSVQHRFSDYFTLLANYTYSHCLSGPPENGDNAGNQFQDPYHPYLDNSNCGSDLRHNFVASAIAKSAVNGSHFKQVLLSNWQVAPIVSATTGVPFTATSGNDRSLTGVNNDRPNLIGNPYAHGAGRLVYLNKPSFAFNAAGAYGNTRPYQFYGPHYTDIDIAVSKFIPVYEDAQLEARAECFNCLNHTNLLNPGGTNVNGLIGNPGTALNSNTFGTITAANQPRILQLSLKVNF
jgi:Carboxypeptidase regulatory-like domain